MWPSLRKTLWNALVMLAGFSLRKLITRAFSIFQRARDETELCYAVADRPFANR